MKNAEEIKRLVKEKYGAIAEEQKPVKKVWSCCGPGSSDDVYNIMAEDYEQVKGYMPSADLGLGCGLPTKTAGISAGDTVVDLGSGAGNDCFVARHEAGSGGRIIGIDFSEEMIAKARMNADRAGYSNVEFRLGELEDMPVEDNFADVVISNCVLNLVPDKNRVFGEIFRILKPGGHFSISDIVLTGELPTALREDAVMYAGCVAGAIQKREYLDLIRQTGFAHVAIQKERAIDIPEEILSRHLDADGIIAFRAGGTGIFSVTVFAEKPTT